MNGALYGLPMADYLKLPAVSAGILRATVDECPLSGWYQSWLNPDREPETSRLADAGSIAHEVLLEGSFSCCAIIKPEDYPADKTGAIPDGWTNKAIRKARDDARAAGKIPILASAFDEIGSMVGAARTFIESLQGGEANHVWAAFQPKGGQSEVTVTWQDGATKARIRPDRTASDGRLIVDAKFTSGSAEPDSWGRNHMFGDGHYVSAALYRRGFERVNGTTPEYVYLVVETKPPYLCSLVGVDPAALALGESKVETGLRLWQQCVERDVWPGYPRRICYPETPAWETAKWEQREAAMPFAERLALGSQA
jgi:hypothetical protein